MKLCFHLLMLCFAVNITFAQNATKDKDFINQVIAEPNIVYQDSLNRNLLAMLKDGLKSNKRKVFYSFKKDSVIYRDEMGGQSPMLRSEATPLVLARIGRMMFSIIADSVMLEDREIAYAYDAIGKINTKKWDADLLKNSQLIATDTVTMVFADIKRDGWNYMYKKGIHKIYNFSKPVFFEIALTVFFIMITDAVGFVGTVSWLFIKK